MVRVDDPYCHWTQLANGTVLITYSGHYGAWETAEMACTGINLLAANVAITVLAILITAACIALAWRNGKRRGWTAYNVVMLFGPVSFMIGHFLELYSVSDWYQWGGNPNWAHIPKPFWYIGDLSIAFVQGFRIEFLLIAFTKPRHWDKYFITGLLAIVTTLGLIATTLFLLGTTHGIASVPFHYSLFYAGGYAVVILADVGLGVAILTVCANNVAMMGAFDVLSIGSAHTANVGRFIRLVRIAAIASLAGDAFFGFCYLVGAIGEGGYTYSLLSILAAPCQNLFLLGSVHVMRRAHSLSRPQTAALKSLEL